MKALKALVLFMGVLIVLGVGLLAWGLMNKGSRLYTGEVHAGSHVDGTINNGDVGSLASAAASFSPLNLDEPPGTVITSMTAFSNFSANGPEALLHLSGGGRPERIVVVDLIRGSVIGRIAVSAASASK